MVKIATWNVNSVKARLTHLLDWQKSPNPDVRLLQELKCVTEEFPRLGIQGAGYQCEVIGQKSYNGVAILAKQKIIDPIYELPGGTDDDHARYVEATVGELRVASVYLPNGNPIDSPKFAYKLDFIERLHNHAKGLFPSERPVVLGGDYNVCLTDEDVWDGRAIARHAPVQPQTRATFPNILHHAWTHPVPPLHRPG